MRLKNMLSKVLQKEVIVNIHDIVEYENPNEYYDDEIEEMSSDTFVININPTISCIINTCSSRDEIKLDRMRNNLLAR